MPQIHGTIPQTLQELLELRATDVGGSLWKWSPTRNCGAPVCYPRASPGGHLAHCRLSHDTSDDSFRFLQFHYRALLVMPQDSRVTVLLASCTGAENSLHAEHSFLREKPMRPQRQVAPFSLIFYLLPPPSPYKRRLPRRERG